MYVEILYLINIRRQYINIHEVTDFHGGFSTIFSALRSNTRWTTQLINIYTPVCIVFNDSMALLTILYLKIKTCRLHINIHDVTILCGGFLTYSIRQVYVPGRPDMQHIGYMSGSASDNKEMHRIGKCFITQDALF